MKDYEIQNIPLQRKPRFTTPNWNRLMIILGRIFELMPWLAIVFLAVYVIAAYDVFINLKTHGHPGISYKMDSM